MVNTTLASTSQVNSSGFKEGEVTKKVEGATAQVPSIGYLGLAVGSMVASLGILLFARKKEYANFVGLWAPSILIMGLYNKLVKIEGSDNKLSSFGSTH